MHFLLSIFSLLNLATESWMGCYTNMYVCHRAFPYLIYCKYADIDLYMWYIIQRCFLGIWRGVLLQGRLRMPTAYKPCLWNWPENLRQWVFTKLHVSLVLTFPFTVHISNTFQKASKPGRGGAESNTYRVMRQCNEHKIN